MEYYPPKVAGAEVEPKEEEEEASEDSAPEFGEGEQAVLPGHGGKIAPSLAAVGLYARSMKPPKNWLTERTYLQCFLYIGVNPEATYRFLKPSTP